MAIMSEELTDRLRIGVLCRSGRNVEWQGRFLGQSIPDDALEEATGHRDGLREAGYASELVQWRPDDLNGLRSELCSGRYDLVFNASSLSEVDFLESAGIPFCGSGSGLVSQDKSERKKLWVDHGVPTAPFIVVDRDDRAGGSILGLSEIRDPAWQLAAPLAYPLFVKPVNGRGSAGVTDDSIVIDREGLVRQAEMIVDRLDQGALVEPYLRGREVTVGIFGSPPTVLMPMEIEYNQARTNSFEHKQDNEILHCPARLSRRMLAKVQEVALKAFSTAGVRDFARVDMIVDSRGKVTVLELNTFAGLQIKTGKESHLHASYIGTIAQKMGLNRAELLGRIVESALQRYGLPIRDRGRLPEVGAW